MEFVGLKRPLLLELPETLGVVLAVSHFSRKKLVRINQMNQAETIGSKPSQWEDPSHEHLIRVELLKRRSSGSKGGSDLWNTSNVPDGQALNGYVP